MTIHSPRIAALLILAVAATTVTFAQPARKATKADVRNETDPALPGVRKLESPYAPLMAVIGGKSAEATFNDEQIKEIAETWRMVNSHGGMLPHDDITKPPTGYWAGPSGGRDNNGRTAGERIKAINPKFILSNYRNGSYIAQFSPWEAAEVEERFPTGISIWNTGCTLVNAIGPDDRKLVVTKFDSAKIPDKPAIRGGRPDIYPFKASTTRGEYSKTTKEYVAWIRLGDEVLRVEKVTSTPQGYEFEVRRGHWKTKAVAHQKGASVFQPIYIGRNMGIDAPDAGLGGRLDDPSPQPGVRYALMTFDPRMHEWLAEKAKRIFDEGYDVCWLDVSVSTWYNNANPYGDAVHPWNVRTGAPLTQDHYREWQQEKNDALYRTFPGKKFWINNVKGNVYFKNGHDRYQLSGENGHHPVDGGSMEMYANHRGNEAAWIETANMTLDIAHSRFNAVAWSKGRNDLDYRRFSYATYLMAYEPGAELYFAIGEGSGLLSKPRDLFYYDLGEPKQKFKTIQEAEVSGVKGLYTRDFARGKVVVNPGKEPNRLKLDREYIDSASGKSVREIALEGNQSAILFLK